MSLLFPLLLIGVMYFLMIRPQMKRAKEHAGMLDKLAKGDEVMTNGGIAGTRRPTSARTSSRVEDRRQRADQAAEAARSRNVLPKGTLKSA